jgi:hypothetical protein
VRGVDDAVEGFAGALSGCQHADVVDHEQFGSVIRAMVLATQPSAVARPTAAVSDSSL